MTIAQNIEGKVESTAAALEEMRRHFEYVIASNDQRYQERFNFQQAALNIASEANERRLHGMNEFRSAMQDQTQTMITRAESETGRFSILTKIEELDKSVNARFDLEMNPLHSKMEQASRPNWALMTSILSVGFVLIAGMYTIIGLKIDSSLAPVTLEVAQVKTATAVNTETIRGDGAFVASSTQADLVSRSDRAQLNERLNALETASATGSADRRASTAKLEQQLIEIETQFKSISHALNIGIDQQQRIDSLLWARVYHEPLPSTDYRPNYYKEN